MKRGLMKCCPFNCPWLKGSWSPKNDVSVPHLPKPEEVTDGLEFEEKINEPNILIIRSIDPCIEENGYQHRTSKYDLMRREYYPQLVVRRGQHFKLNITLSRPYDESKDGISFIFVVDDEDKPTHGSGTMVGVPLLKKPDRNLPWNVYIHSIKDNVITVNVVTPPDAIVARWRMEVDTKIIDAGSYCYCWETKIYILFNPWCKQDQVYMKSQEWKDESVLNDVGIIYRGTYNRIKPVIWKYDQFDEDILDCALYLVHVVGKVKCNLRSDPVRVTRALSAAVNAADDEGVVVGRWSTDFSGGIAPTKWLGSKEILQGYYKKKKPVKYGQCWVFAGVLTTICRTLGLPARTVTNYSSAHDTQNSLTVDYFMDAKGTIMDDMNSDSVWNFHVWNEVYMTRPDLGKEYSGWQAIDSTPQELSEDMYRCGPASIIAVKQGEVLRPHDCNFLFSEVNADKVYWKYNGPNKPLKLLRKDVLAIGKFLSTKAPGTFEREDITAEYKYPEKTNDERTTMMKALQQSSSIFSRYYLNEDFNDIYFRLRLLDDVKIGQPFDVSLEIRNRSSSTSYTVSVILRLHVVTYTGKVGEMVKEDHFKVTVQPDITHEVKLSVTYDEYVKKLIDQCGFNISCMASVLDTNYEFFTQDDFRLRKPDIKIHLHNNPVESIETTADVEVENPLPIPIKKGEFTVEGPGITGTIKLKVKNIPPGDKARSEFKFTPTRIGEFAIGAKFSCKQMDDVDGYLMINVEPKKEQDYQN
ncbi:annulin-like [Rhynchophorus ferrugineus]|uniref:annulin-like n=1 Tax=Rhynchophorus ferrugineus TaxID=354439 RepID=UPI003FCE03AB